MTALASSYASGDDAATTGVACRVLPSHLSPQIVPILQNTGDPLRRHGFSEGQAQAELNLPRGSGADVVGSEAVIVTVEVHERSDLPERARRRDRAPGHHRAARGLVVTCRCVVQLQVGVGELVVVKEVKR